MKAIVIEDRGTFGPALVRQLEPLGVQARWIPHPVAADLGAATWASVPLVLLDALDLSSQQDDRRRSRLTSLDVLAAIARVPRQDRPRVVVYSTHMAKPEVNIPLRGAEVADAFYDVAAHQLMRTHERTWRQVWDPDAAFDKAAQVWVRRNVLAPLHAESAGYNMAVEVVRRIAGLPYQW